ncbi:MAG: thermonuclease family protein [bacterium]
MENPTTNKNWFVRHKLLTGALGIGIFLIVIIALASSGEPNTATSTATPTSIIVVESPTPSIEAIAEQPSPEVEGTVTTTPTIEGILVTKVVDGDTIQLEGDKTVRYIGIDTPETVHPSQPVGCFGKEASAKNKELVEGKRVRLEKDISETDKYGRLLRYVYIGDTFVNDYLVRQGYANATSYPPDVKYQDQFRQAEQEARTDKRGLWGKCSTTQTTPAAQTAATSKPQPTKAAAIATPKPAATSSSSGAYTGADKDCPDFKTQAEAQSFFISQGGPSKDPHRLDQDKDGVACETLP